MANNNPHNPSKSVNDAVYKLQLALLYGGAKTLDHLYLTASIISRANYSDVVTERTIADLCGYLLCSNALPPQADRPCQGHHHISLKEQKVYDLTETRLYCSAKCLIDSKVFAQSLSEERCDALDFGKVDRQCGEKKEEEEEEVEDSGLSSKMKIEEKSGVIVGS